MKQKGKKELKRQWGKTHSNQKQIKIKNTKSKTMSLKEIQNLQQRKTRNYKRRFKKNSNL